MKLPPKRLPYISPIWSLLRTNWSVYCIARTLGTSLELTWAMSIVDVNYHHTGTVTHAETQLGFVSEVAKDKPTSCTPRSA